MSNAETRVNALSGESAAQSPRASAAGDVPAWVLTSLGAAVQAIAVALIIAVGSADGPPPGIGPYVFALGFGAVLLLRSVAPVAVLVAAVLGTFAYYAAGYPPIGMAVPVFGAFYNASERGRVAVATVTGGVLLAVSLYFRIQDGESSAVLAYDVITNAALIGCAVALALMVRGRRHLREEQERALLLERQAQQERAARQLEAQRLQVARDVHDSIGHALSLVSVQARVAQQSLGRDEAGVSRALDNMVQASSTSLADLRRTLATLRSDRDDSGHAPVTLDGIERTAQAARDAGLDVELDLDLGDTQVPGPVAGAAFRIVQESVTNVLRHARAEHVRIGVRVADGQVHVEVADDGRGAAAAGRDRGRTGQGISGMRDRAALLGGSLEIASGDQGLRVLAALPLNPDAAEVGR
ncbi:sensor histidine kinase [Ornithinicoccus hortensis]|uniref:histidine kinase n=1 Tax=Ornithinicoccus hortensis TaxID=82346 RepID=A0A542YMK4_9MICO|nr:histidine kinase [Ornithinicoccus hortensis]TQL49316.1 signal transduction histidine kinase [Ornithinicoccus hortensis]